MQITNKNNFVIDLPITDFIVDQLDDFDRISWHDAFNPMVFKAISLNDDADESIATKVDSALENIGLIGHVNQILNGPVITRVFFKLDSITCDQIMKASAASTISTLAMLLMSNDIVVSLDPPSQSVVIDIPNKNRVNIPFGNALLANTDSMEIPICIGVDVTGKPLAFDLADAPHLLIAGQSGSGKSVAINTIIASICQHRSPFHTQLILIDPKKTELDIYKQLGNLYTKVITDMSLALNTLKDLCTEMERRQNILAEAHVRSIKAFNQNVLNGVHMDDLKFYNYQPLPYLVVIIDEFADLILTADKEVVNVIARLTAVGRALGIHIIIGTQRPSVKVIPGEIKANIPTRIAFKTASQVDSVTILDSAGAEKLLGKGDMIVKLNGKPLFRAHGSFISDDLAERIAKNFNGRILSDFDNDIFHRLSGINVTNSRLYYNGKPCTYFLAKGMVDYIDTLTADNGGCDDFCRQVIIRFNKKNVECNPKYTASIFYLSVLMYARRKAKLFNSEH